MKKLFTGFLFIVCSFSSWAQHFGFSYEVSSYVPAGVSEVQLNGLTATLGKNKVNGHLMVASGDQVVIVNEANGKVITRFGGNGKFQNVQSITTDGQGNYYIGDYGSKMVVKYDTNGNYLLSWGSFGSGNGQFKGLEGICTDDVDNIYVADASNNRIQKFDAQGNFIASWGTAGSGNGQFSSPYAITYWPSLGSLIVGDANNNRIQTFDKLGVFKSQTALTVSPYSLDVDLVNNRLLVFAQGKIFQFDNNLAAPLATWGPNGVGGRRRSPRCGCRRGFRRLRLSIRGRHLTSSWRRRSSSVEHQHHRPQIDNIANFQLHLLDHASVRRRDLHRRLVALDGDQTLFFLDLVAGLDEQLDHRHVLEVADVRYLDIDQCHRCAFRSEQDAAEVREDLAEVGIEPGRRGAVDHPMVVRQRQRQRQAWHEGLAVPDRFHLTFRQSQDGHLGRIDDRREMRTADAPE